MYSSCDRPVGISRYMGGWLRGVLGVVLFLVLTLVFLKPVFAESYTLNIDYSDGGLYLPGAAGITVPLNFNFNELQEYTSVDDGRIFTFPIDVVADPRNAGKFQICVFKNMEASERGMCEALTASGSTDTLAVISNFTIDRDDANEANISFSVKDAEGNPVELFVVMDEDGTYRFTDKYEMNEANLWNDGAGRISFLVDDNGNIIAAESTDTPPDAQTVTDDPSNPDAADLLDEERKLTCASSGAAESLGWVVCPILNMLSNASDTIYTQYVEPALRVEPTLFSQNENTGTRYAWRIFQGMANVIFIILLLVVIISQVTGVGIDNYGVKKILPKLIVAAILINLSYLICLVLVDLSNIVGNGVQAMFNSLPTEAPTEITGIVEGARPIDITEGGVSIASVGRTGLTGVALLGIIVASIWSAVSTAGVLGGIILPLIVAAISIVIAVFFLFLLLAARQAGVVALTVISPLAFACYILPNTKKLFDRWVKVGWGLILVYPICGLLVGAGNYVSRLLIAVGAGGGGFAMAFMAMVVGIVPIFFIPSVLKSAFVAAGNIGAKISSIGSQVRGRATRGIQGSDAYKALQERGKEGAARRFAGVRRNADGTYSTRELGRFGRLVRGGSRRVAESRSQFLSDQEKRRREANLLGTGFEAGLAGVESKVDAQRDANAEAMLSYGRATYVDDRGNTITVNAGDKNSVGAYHAAVLRKYHNATTDEERANAMSEIRAAQKSLSRTDAGRGFVQSNLERAIVSGYSSGAGEAARHLQSEFGDLYKSKNRGADRMIGDLASGRDMNSIRSDIGSGVYELAGTDKYDATSLVGADERALSNMVNAVNRSIANNENMEQVAQIQNTARKAIEMYNQGRLSVKPETLRYVEDIAGVRANLAGGATPGVPSGTSRSTGVAREGEPFSPRNQDATGQSQRTEGPTE